jgi:hypothetical protein
MKYFYQAIILIFIATRTFSQAPVFEWAGQCGNPPNTTDTKTTLASAPDGSFYLSGEFLDTVQFCDKIMVSSGGTDVFLVKYTSGGVPVWSLKIGGEDYDYVSKTICDAEGNVIIAGYFYGTTRIGQDLYTSYGSQDIFVAKFNSAGDFLWSFRAGGQMADYVAGLALDAGRNIVITGYFYGDMAFGDTIISALAGSDIYLAKFNADGDLLWVTQAGGSSSEQVRSADCDPDGNIILTGSFYYDISFGDTALATTNPVGVFTAKYLPDGGLDRVFQLDGTMLTPEIYVAAGPGGDFFIAGDFSDKLIFGDQVFDAGPFNQDIFVAKYDAACNLQWAHHAFSASSDQVAGMVAGEDDGLYMTGHYLDTIQFDQLTMPYHLCCGSREIFIVNYNSEGNVVWGDSISGTRAGIQSIAMSGQGKLILSGLFSADLSLGDLKLSSYNEYRNYITSVNTGMYNDAGQNLKIDGLRVFPNPALDKIRIPVQSKEIEFNYVIYSISGLAIKRGTANSGDYIDVDFLPAGQYLLRLSTSRESLMHSCLFIKQ